MSKSGEIFQRIEDVNAKMQVSKAELDNYKTEEGVRSWLTED